MVLGYECLRRAKKEGHCERCGNGREREGKKIKEWRRLDWDVNPLKLSVLSEMRHTARRLAKRESGMTGAGSLQSGKRETTARMRWNCYVQGGLCCGGLNQGDEDGTKVGCGGATKSATLVQVAASKILRFRNIGGGPESSHTIRAYLHRDLTDTLLQGHQTMTAVHWSVLLPVLTYKPQQCRSSVKR